MITTVTLNAAIDKTYMLPSLQVNTVNRTASMFAEPGGKGINVAKVLQALDVPVTATGITGGYNGKQIMSRLDRIGLMHRFVEVSEESRLCLNILAQNTGHETEILETGPEIGESDWQTVKETIKELAIDSDYIIFSGSLPKGLADDSYKALIQMVKKFSPKVILDTSGPALTQALKARPYMITPNRDEFAKLLNRDYMTADDIIGTLNERRYTGVPLVIVSLGDEGAIASVEGEIYRIDVPDISAVNPVGSGDAFTAGMAAGLLWNKPITDTFKLAAAAGAANALEEKAGHVSPYEVKTLKQKVRVEKVGDTT